MSAPITLSVAGILLNWLVEVGDSVQAGDVVAEIEADKATVEIEAPASGMLSAQAAGPGDELAEGAIIGVITAAGETAAPATPEPAPVVSEEKAAPAPTPSVDPPEADARLPAGVRASPLARKLAAERGIDISQVSGSGLGGRIVRADVESYRAVAPVSPTPVAAGSDYEDLPLGRMRRRIGEGTARSKREAPHFYCDSGGRCRIVAGFARAMER